MDVKTTVDKSLVVVAALLMCAGASPAAELHPIVDVQNGYLFGATEDGKWVKADEAAKALPDQTTYVVYGLTESLGKVKGGKAKGEEGPCEGTWVVGLSDKPEKGAIALAAPWNALPRKLSPLDATQTVYIDAVGNFLKTKGITEPKVKIDSIFRVDLDGDGKMEIVIGSNYYEGEEIIIYRCDPKKVEALLSVSCGA